ncbi:MAG: AAA family ATPase, partial [Desulfobacterales bacterium]|nr:AAA family ATPase [Desulfobacterales bacterium]
MLNIEGYQFTEKIYESNKTIVYRGIRNSDQIPVIAKVLRVDVSNYVQQRNYQHEYQITRYLDIPGVLKTYALVNTNNSIALILEDFGGVTLDKYLVSDPKELNQLLQIAMSVTDIIDMIHQHGIIHKDIKPSNILINPDTLQIKISDFSISSQIAREMKRSSPPERIEGTLNYISPEQTGRMNRCIDYRTDYYSLGVLFYWMFSKCLPFETKEPIELIYAHVAKQAVPVHEINLDIPVPLSSIVMKLLSKNAEDRYQSAFGLKTDLRKCYRDIQTTGTVASFDLGLSDISSVFQFPEHLYGREDEVQHLYNLLDKAAAGEKQIVFLSGPSGIGKSFLITELQKKNIGIKGFFISGKYDHLRINTPYSSIVQAFHELIRQILSEPDKNIQEWKKKIEETLKDTGKLLVNILPHLDRLIDTTPYDQDSTELSSRHFNIVFRNFIHIFATSSHPLCLFLDDMQWMDSASLKLLKSILTDNRLNHFFFIGSYRNTEISDDDCISHLLQDLKHYAITFHELQLSPLSVPAIESLIRDMLRIPFAQTKRLATIVHVKTNGNPLFVKSFLQSLFKENFIFFKDGWQVQFNPIEFINYPDNIQVVLEQHVKRISENTQKILKIASCMGLSLYIDTLATVYGKSEEETIDDLREAIDEGILIKIEDSVKFIHDRIKEVLYNQIPINERLEIHFQIGTTLLSQTHEDQLVDRVFFIVYQLNTAIGFITLPFERKKVASLNLLAAQRAQQANAYEAAMQYIEQAQLLLPVDPWQREYDIMLRIVAEKAKISYLKGEVELSRAYCTEILEHAKTAIDKSLGYEILIKQATSSNEMDKALSVAFSAFESFGVYIPQSATDFLVLRLTAITRLRLLLKTIEDLENLNELSDPVKRSIIRILTILLVPLYVTNHRYFILITLKLIHHILAYGHSTDSALTFVCYGQILCRFSKDIDAGYTYSQLALRLLDQYPSQSISAKVHFIYGASIHYWKHPVYESLEYLLKAIQHGHDSGEDETVAYAYFVYFLTLFFMGKPISEVIEQCATYHSTILKLNKVVVSQLFSLFYQFVIVLQKDTSYPLVIRGDICNEEEFLNQIKTNDNRAALGVYCVFKQRLFFLSGDYQIAIHWAIKAERQIRHFFSVLPMIDHVFFYSLSLCFLYPSVDKSERNRIVNQFKRLLNQFQTWAKHATYNLEHRYLILQAAYSRMNGQIFEAIQLLIKGISISREYGFIPDEAIAVELMASCYASLNMTKESSIYIKEARCLYSAWGVKAKIIDIELNHKELLSVKLDVNTREEWNEMITASSSSTNIDVNSIIQSYRTISREVVIENLIKKLIRIVMENACAQRVVFLMQKKEQFFIEAEGNVNEEDVTLLRSIPLDEQGMLPESILRYVINTRETIVIDDASIDLRYADDPYIQKQKPRSVMCMPMIYQNRITGILYMENNLGKAVFTSERRRVIDVLSVQASISLENALLYSKLIGEVVNRQKTEIALTESQEKYKFVVENANDAIVVLQDNIIKFCNKKTSDILGFNEKEILSKYFLDFIYTEDRELVETRYQARITG